MLQPIIIPADLSKFLPAQNLNLPGWTWVINDRGEYETGYSAGGVDYALCYVRRHHYNGGTMTAAVYRHDPSCTPPLVNEI